jgi:hypothetical protein
MVSQDRHTHNCNRVCSKEAQIEQQIYACSHTNLLVRRKCEI